MGEGNHLVDGSELVRKPVLQVLLHSALPVELRLIDKATKFSVVLHGQVCYCICVFLASGAVGSGCCSEISSMFTEQL